MMPSPSSGSTGDSARSDSSAPPAVPESPAFASASSPHADAERYLDALYRVSGFISAVTSLPDLLGMVMEESKALMKAEASSLLLYDAEHDDLYFEVALGEAGATVKQRIRLALGEGIAGLCARERQPIVVNDAANDPRHSKRADRESLFVTRNLLAVPMIARGEKLVGVLEVLNTLDRPTFSDADVKILEIFADQAALAIDNARLIAQSLENERLAAIGVAVAGISHYVKNILAGMTGSSSLIEHGLQQDDIALIRECWPIFGRSQKKITTLVQDMLTYSKERTPEYQPTCFNALAEQVAQECKATAEERAVELETDLEPAMATVQADPLQLHDCLLNLVGNAIDASQNASGNGRVVIRTKTRDEGKTLSITVEDNGCGIPEEDVAHIFQPFYSTKGSKGTGLGLAVVQKIVREHRGGIQVETEPGQGTCFEVRIPCHPPPTQESR